MVTLWDSTAEQFDGSSMPVVAIKGGRLAEFLGGKSISINNNSTMSINPDIPKAHQLRGWYDSLSDQHQFSSVSSKGGNEGKLLRYFSFQINGAYILWYLFASI